MIKIKTKFLFYLVIIICLQATELKILSVKISEIIVLILGAVYIKISKSKEKKIIFFFLLLTLKTLFLNVFVDFYIPTEETSFLKNPYIISLSRFLELLCCYYLINICIIYFNKEKENVKLHIRNIIDIQVCIAVFYLFVYVLYQIGLFKLENDYVKDLLVYNTEAGYSIKYRIKGLFVEGGPLGLFYASIFLLLVLEREKAYLLMSFLIIFILWGTQSKAGLLMITSYFLIDYFYIRKARSVLFLTIPLLLFIIIFGFVIYNSYFQALQNLEFIVQAFTPADSTEIDKNLLMGRVTATIILPNLLFHNLFFGIGLGNYALVRNNPIYRGFLPEVPYWDLHGFGGIVDVLVEGGLIFFIFMLLYVKKLWNRCHTIKQKRVFLIFILCFIFGVQIYFLYPWFILSYLIFLQNNEITLKNSEVAYKLKHKSNLYNG